MCATYKLSFLRLILPELMTGSKDLSNRPIYAVLNVAPSLWTADVLTSQMNLRTFSPIATAHLSCARYTWRGTCHVMYFKRARRNSTKYRADDLCGNLICEYFCWILGDPHFFFGRSLPFVIVSIILKNKKNLYVGSLNYFSYTIQIGSNWYMDTGVRDLPVLRLILPELMT